MAARGARARPASPPPATRGGCVRGKGGLAGAPLRTAGKGRAGGGARAVGGAGAKSGDGGNCCERPGGRGGRGGPATRGGRATAVGGRGGKGHVRGSTGFVAGEIDGGSGLPGQPGADCPPVENLT